MAPHPVEEEMGLSANEILDVIQRSDRCYQTVRGYVAERHLERILERLVAAGSIDGFERLNQDGRPDFTVTWRGVELTLECKNITTRSLKTGRWSVDFQRTRNQLSGGLGRFYKPDEFTVLAAAARSFGQWTFRFARLERLPTVIFKGVVCVKKAVSVSQQDDGVWTSDLLTVIGDDSA